MGIPTLISTATADGDANLDITSGIDSTYDEYMFVMTDISPSTDGANFLFQVNAAGASGFNETMTSTYFWVKHGDDDSTDLAYVDSLDQAQGTAFQFLGNAYEESQGGAGILHLFSPSSTTYVKHFYARITHFSNGGGVAREDNIAGYINTTTAIDEISFKVSTGTFDGVIQMYGIA